MWVGLIQSVERLNRKHTKVPKEEGTLLTDCLLTQAVTSALPWVSSLMAYPEDLGLAQTIV